MEYCSLRKFILKEGLNPAEIHYRIVFSTVKKWMAEFRYGCESGLVIHVKYIQREQPHLKSPNTSVTFRTRNCDGGCRISMDYLRFRTILSRQCLARFSKNKRDTLRFTKNKRESLRQYVIKRGVTITYLNRYNCPCSE